MLLCIKHYLHLNKSLIWLPFLITLICAVCFCKSGLEKEYWFWPIMFLVFHAGLVIAGFACPGHDTVFGYAGIGVSSPCTFMLLVFLRAFS